MEKDTLYRIWLAEALGAASRDYRVLLDSGLTPQDLYAADDAAVGAMEGIGARARMRLCDKSLEEAYRILQYCTGHDIDVLHVGLPGYPESLAAIDTPPVVLYCRGTMPNLNEKLAIAVVGTRNVSSYGMRTSYSLSYDLARAGAVVVSGMARGTDGIAACGAMEAGGSTVAVLGCGIDIVYPAEHRKLEEAVVKHGAVITEYAPGTGARSWQFPQRNRIISGLAQGTLVIEASAKSGSLLTAAAASEQGRRVFAVPANLDNPAAVGTNELLRDGATLVLTAEDVLSAFPKAAGISVQPNGSARSTFSTAYLEKYGVKPSTDETDAASAATSVRVRLSSKAERDKGRPNPRPEIDRVDAPPPAVKPVTPEPDDLTEIEKQVLSAFPVDAAVTLDAVNLPGIGIGEIIAALTMLEIRGLISALPGGLYLRT